MIYNEIIAKYPGIAFGSVPGLEGAVIGYDDIEWRLIYSIKDALSILTQGKGLEQSDALDFLLEELHKPIEAGSPIWCHDNLTICD